MLGFKPIKYLTVGHTFQVVDGKVTDEKTDNLNLQWLKTVGAIIALLPGTIIGFTFRLLALQFVDVKNKYTVAIKHLQTKTSPLEEKIATLSSQLSEKTILVEQAESKSKENSEKFISLQTKLDETVGNLEEKITALTNQLKDKTTQLEQAEVNKKENSEKITNLQTQLQEAKTKLSEIESSKKAGTTPLAKTSVKPKKKVAIPPIEKQMISLPSQPMLVPRYGEYIIRWSHWLNPGTMNKGEEIKTNFLNALQNRFPMIKFLVDSPADQAKNSLCIVFMHLEGSRSEPSRSYEEIATEAEKGIPILVVYDNNQTHDISQHSIDFAKCYKAKNFIYNLFFTCIDLQNPDSFSQAPFTLGNISGNLQDWILEKKG